jgi:hypothetical protein
MSALAPTIAMLTALALLVGGGWMFAARRQDRTKAALMLVMAAVLIANVAIWTL